MNKLEAIMAERQPSTPAECLVDAETVLGAWADNIEKANQKGEHTKHIRFLRDRAKRYHDSIQDVLKLEVLVASLENRIDDLMAQKQDVEADCEELMEEVNTLRKGMI